ESYSNEVDAELNRAIDWLRAEGVERVILTGDFHFSTQMVGADTNDFYPAMEDAAEGVAVAARWSATARRLHDDFATSVGFVNGKRCLGGLLELMVHCHYLVAVEDAALGMPEVTLPVVPGMEGCHWPFRKAGSADWPKLVALLLEGKPVKARDAVGWLVDHAGPIDDAIAVAFKIASGGDHGLSRRAVDEKALAAVTDKMPDLTAAGSPETESARKAILDNVRTSCGAPLAEAITLQAKHSGGFMETPEFRGGAIGAIYQKTMLV
ncbi:MAG: enoyl-CoA hydratase/isomerase family protein, partial [bacterium]|nr:enoyl-CoA hydratase/isomerase family protein [bacterium]